MIARLDRRSKRSMNTMGICLASIGVMFVGPLGCGDDAVDLMPLPVEFGPPPPDLPPVPPANEASPSTNVSTFPVVPLDAPGCQNATRAIFEFRHTFISTTKHLYTNDFDEGISSEGYSYHSPLNMFVENIPGTIPVYRCHRAGQESTHYLSIEVGCEGGVTEDPDDPVLGYLYSPSLPQPAGSKPWYRSSSGSDHVIHFTATPPRGFTFNYLMGYGPTLACKNLATTCQPYPSSYTGYTVNPHLDADTGEYVAYGDHAPNPPWFGDYGRARKGLPSPFGNPSNAILTGDWGTTNNVDWDARKQKAECGYTDWMIGLSTAPTHHGAAHAFRCAMSEYKLGPRNFGSSCWTERGERLGSSGTGVFRNRNADWDVGYTKSSCSNGSYLAGVSSDPNNHNQLAGLLCCTEPDLGLNDCSTVVFGQPSSEQNTSTTVDDHDNIVPYDWDPPYGTSTFPKAECGAGRRMMGASKDQDGKLHAILCCGTSDPPPARENVSCCSPQTLQKALANCNADNKTYESDCENIVAPCCNSDPNSDGFGGGVCAAVSAAMRKDATTADGDPYANAPGTAADGATCESTGHPAAWSFAYNKKDGGGNKTFGGSFSGDVGLSAGPFSATGRAKVEADASLFGMKIGIAHAELNGNITDNDPLTARIVALGRDLYVYPSASSSQKHPSASASTTYTVTFFENTEIISLFAVPITIKGTIAGEVGVNASAQNGGNTLTFNATPFVGATATCSAAIGGGKGRFRLESGVEGSLNLFHASLPTTASVSPFTNHVSYNFHSDFTVTELNGKVGAFLKVRLKPFFKKTFKHTLSSWGGLTQTTRLFSHNGCMTY